MLDPTDTISLPLPEAARPEPQDANAPSALEVSDQQEDPGAARPQYPFIVRLHRLEETSAGYFRPAASVEIAPMFRTTGLLRALPAEDLKILILILTFLSPNGDLLPTVQQLADALRVPEGSLRQRLTRLSAFKWHGERVIQVLSRESGMDAVTISSHLITIEHDTPTTFDARPAIQAAGREAVIEHSRSVYARPRAEVERDIAERMGWELPVATTEQADRTPEEEATTSLRNRLRLIGVPKEHVDDLLARFDHVRIEQQLQWLPYRHAKMPAKFIVAAIMGNYEAPPALRSVTAASPEHVAEHVAPEEASTHSSDPHVVAPER